MDEFQAFRKKVLDHQVQLVRNSKNPEWIIQNEQQIRIEATKLLQKYIKNETFESLYNGDIIAPNKKFQANVQLIARMKVVTQGQSEQAQVTQNSVDPKQKLQEMKQHQQQQLINSLQQNIDKTNSRIEHHQKENVNLEQQIQTLDKQILELQQQLQTQVAKLQLAFETGQRLSQSVSEKQLQKQKINQVLNYAKLQGVEIEQFAQNLATQPQKKTTDVVQRKIPDIYDVDEKITKSQSVMNRRPSLDKDEKLQKQTPSRISQQPPKKTNKLDSALDSILKTPQSHQTKIAQKETRGQSNLRIEVKKSPSVIQHKQQPAVVQQKLQTPKKADQIQPQVTNDSMNEYILEETPLKAMQDLIDSQQSTQPSEQDKKLQQQQKLAQARQLAMQRVQEYKKKEKQQQQQQLSNTEKLLKQRDDRISQFKKNYQPPKQNLLVYESPATQPSAEEQRIKQLREQEILQQKALENLEYAKRTAKKNVIQEAQMKQFSDISALDDQVIQDMDKILDEIDDEIFK